MFANSCRYTLSVYGHKNKNGELYKKNTIITIKAPGAMIYNDFKFLVQNVTMSRDPEDGDVTTLDLCLPGTYSGEIPSSFPWED
jgi:prophage tail gpP-like protein